MTRIAWTEATWNPVTGCDRVSPGCDHCYAAVMAKRLQAMGAAKYQRDGDPRTSGPGFGVSTHPGVLAEPLRWRKPRQVFVNSMAHVPDPDQTPRPGPVVADALGRPRPCPAGERVARRIRMRRIAGDEFAALASTYSAREKAQAARGLLRRLHPEIGAAVHPLRQIYRH